MLPWEARYDRVSAWAKTLKAPPDLIALQEVWFRFRYFAGGVDPADYETMFALINSLNAATGQHYRVAYGSSTFTKQGLHRLFAGRAVLYNSDRVTNVTGAALSQPAADGTPEPVNGWEDWTPTGAHLRSSHPCTETRDDQRALCSLIDTQPYLAYGYRDQHGTWLLGPDTSVYSFKERPNEFLVLHNVHIQFADYDAAFAALRAVISSAQARMGGRTMIFPPIVEGDFNVGKADMETETSPTGRLPDFEIAGYDPAEVVGVLIGRNDRFSAMVDPTMTSVTIPTPAPTPDLCAPGDRLWSDHCAIFAELVPPIRTT